MSKKMCNHMLWPQGALQGVPSKMNPTFAHIYWAASVPLWTTVLLLVGSQEAGEMTGGPSVIEDRTCFTYTSFKLK